MFKRSTEVVRVTNPKNFSSVKAASCSNDATYRCEFCSKDWDSETELHYHKRSHFRQIQRRIDKFTDFCWTCIRSFKSREILLIHFRVCHLLSSLNAQRVERNIFVCDVCSSIFFNKKMLILHMMIRHPNPSRKCKKQRYECTSCNRQINLKNAWNHVHLHEMVGLRICGLCFKRFSSWKELRHHLDMHKSYLHCDICSTNFDKRNHFLFHLEQHNRSIDNDDEWKKMQLVDKYFVNNNWNGNKAQYQTLLPYQGLKLQGDISICILCREICTSCKERKQHILHHYKYNGMKSEIKEEPGTTLATVKQENERTDILPKLACSCGETFTYNILLKQHLLRNKGSEFSHKALSENEISNLISVQDDTTIVIEIIDS